MNSRRDTMILLTPAFPADESETSWVTTQQTFTRILQQSYPHLQIRVCTFYYPDKIDSYRWREISVDSFQGLRDRKGRRIFFWRRIWQSLNRIRREEKVVGILSFWCGECALLGHYFGLRYNIPHFCWLCGQDGRASNKLVRWIRPKAGELIAMSDALRREFERNHGIRPAHMIPNGIDPQAFADSIPSASRPIDILAVGSLQPLKQYDQFIEVIAAIKRAHSGIQARHCGSGTEQTRIQNMIDERNLGGTVELLGEQSHPTVLHLMRQSRIFLHTSSYEGFGVVCMEALYAGAQVISFFRPMDEEIPGWHIVGSKEEMAAKAIELLDQQSQFTQMKVYLMQDAVREIMALYDR